MFDGVWSKEASKALRDGAVVEKRTFIDRGRGSKLGKFESMYFLNHLIPILSIADEFLKFISRGLISTNSHFSKISRGLIFAKIQKIREIAKFYPHEN